jgi:hypothetical protein
MAMPDIQLLDQDHAKATWMLWEVCNLAEESTTAATDQVKSATTCCLGGFYKTEVSRNEQGEWKFERVELNLTFNQPYPNTVK